MRELDQQGLRNVRVASEDGMEVLQNNIPDQSLAGILIFFPDPWHKKKHKKRRMIQAEFVHMAALDYSKVGFCILPLTGRIMHSRCSKCYRPSRCTDKHQS